MSISVFHRLLSFLQALSKACEVVSMVTRDSALVRSDNFSLCVHAVRVLAETYSGATEDEGNKDNVTGRQTIV